MKVSDQTHLGQLEQSARRFAFEPPRRSTCLLPYSSDRFWRTACVGLSTALGLLLLTTLDAPAATRSSANYAMVAEITDGGGSPSQNASAQFALQGSMESIAGGSSQSTPYLVQHGYILQATANCPPTPQADTSTTATNTAVIISVLANDTDPDGDGLTVLRVTLPGHGIATINGGLSVTYTPADGFTGSDSFTYTATDGLGETGTATVTVLTVIPVNNAPSFVKGADPIPVAQNSEPQVIPGWATTISAGPPEEAGQAVNFIVSNDFPALFSASPEIDAGGTLTFIPTPYLRGTSLVTIWLHDDGGIANGGQDTSPAQTLTIIVGDPTDADGDGLPDDWEVANGLSAHEPGYDPALVDCDGDGFSDQQELLAGTNPGSTADALRVVVTEQTGGGEAISFPTVAGKVYRVERKVDFPSGIWVQVGSDVTGTGAAMQIIDAEAIALSKAVYRVVVVP